MTPETFDTLHEAWTNRASPEHDAPASEGGWTAGPYERDGRTVYVLQPSGDRRVPMVNRWSCLLNAAPGTPDSELDAVAALFQAAPAMAEALRAALDLVDKLSGAIARAQALHQDDESMAGWEEIGDWKIDGTLASYRAECKEALALAEGGGR